MPKIKKQYIGQVEVDGVLQDQVTGTDYMSGFLNHPVRVIQQFSDCLPLAYPAITRTGFEGLTGNESVIPFDDSKTIVFNSAHATAWIYFYSRPKDGSTIKLFDPAGSIELGDVIAQPGIRQDDLSVSTVDDLSRQKVYEVEIVSVGSPALSAAGWNSQGYPTEDTPAIQGSWTGIKNLENLQIDTDNPYSLKLSINTLNQQAPPAEGEPLETDPEEFDVGTFTVSITGLGGYAAANTELIFEMPDDGEERAIVDCTPVNPTDDDDWVVPANILAYYEGLTVTWPNPRNIVQITETSDSSTAFETKYNVIPGSYPDWIYILPFPDKFRWRKSSEVNLQWDSWEPAEDGQYIGSGNIKQDLLIKNLRYSNVDNEGYIYSDSIIISEEYASLINLPSGLSAKVYARGDLSAGDDNEYYEVEYTANGSTWTSIGTIGQLKPSQTGGYWSGLTAYAPFADGGYFTEKNIQYVVKDESGNPLYLKMPDDPSISQPLAMPALNEETGVSNPLQFRVRVGSAVSWGRCELKIVLSYSGQFLGVDGIDNADASGNNLLLSWGDFANHGVGDKWTINVDDSTTQTFEFNRGVITNPNHTEVNVNKLVRSRDKLNSIFAKAINDSGLQINARHDGKRVLLEQTIPGEVGNIQIFADARAKVHVSNSKNFVVGADGAVTGSFSGGENYLVSYPTTLPVESRWLHNQIVTPNVLSSDEERILNDVGLIATGSTKKGVADYGTIYDNKVDAIKIAPFQDTSLSPDLDDEFYQAGVPKEKYEGFSSPLKSKTKISIKLPVREEQSFGFDDYKRGSSLFQAMVYYNFATQTWEKVGPTNYGFHPSPENADELQRFFENACIGFSRGVELIQSAPQVSSLPISDFGFPMHPKYNATDDQTLKMSNYIDKPFVLEKFVIEFDAEWYEGNDYSKRTVMYDVGADGRITRIDEDGAYNNKAAINNFFILNQRDWVGEYEYSPTGLPIKYWYPPNYNRDIDQSSSNLAENRYMWNGSSYRYIGAGSLVSLFRFLPGASESYNDDKAAVVVNEIDAERNFDNAISPNVATYPTINRESSPWTFPEGASKENFSSSARFEVSPDAPPPDGDPPPAKKLPILQISLGNMLGIDTPAFTNPALDLELPYEEVITQNLGWVQSADEAIGTTTTFTEYNSGDRAWAQHYGNAPGPDSYILQPTSRLSNYPGKEDLHYIISNSRDDGPSSELKRYNIRIMSTTTVASQGQTYTVRYLFAQGAGLFPDSNWEDDLNEPPDPGMELRSTGNYRSEALRFQIAKYPDMDDLTPDQQTLLATSEYASVGDLWNPGVDAADAVNANGLQWLARADFIDNLEWIDINVHEPDYQKQGIWQEAVAVLDQEVLFGEGHTAGYFVRWIQEGNSGWPDTWVFSDISVDTDPSFTKSLWFKPGASSTNMNLISVVAADALPNKFWLMIARDGTLRLLIDSGRNRVYSKIISPEPVTDGNWHHAILTYEAASSKFNLWLDGDHIGFYVIPQGEDEDGDLLWTKQLYDAEPLTEADAVIKALDLKAAGIYPPPNSNDRNTNPDGTWIETPYANDEWRYTGEESIIVEGVRIYISLAEYMQRLGYRPYRPWYFETNDVVVIGADADKAAPTYAAGTLKYDNHFIGEIADVATWNRALDGTSAKAIYNLRSGYYKVSKGSNISLKGNIPHRFESPVGQAYRLREGDSYSSADLDSGTIPNKLISRYLINVPKLKIDVEGSHKYEPTVVGLAKYYEDSPYQPFDNSVLSGNKKYSIDLNASAYLKLGRLGEYLPNVLPIDNDRSGSEFSFFTWIKMPEVKEGNPVIFSINDAAGRNRLIFYIDTADRLYAKAGQNIEKPSGMRLAIFVKSAALSETELMDPTISADVLWTDTLDGVAALGDLSLSSGYRVFTNNVRAAKKWEINIGSDPDVKEIDDNLWHHVGFTHSLTELGNSKFEIYFDGIKESVHTETVWRVAGPSNDRYLLTFAPGETANSAGYHNDIFTENGGWTDGGYKRAHQETYTNSGGSRFHEPLSLQPNDRVSVGQEYDVKYRRFFYTTRDGERRYRSKRYRVASQKINARVTDITIWEGALSADSVEKLESAKNGESTAVLHYASKKGTARDLVTYGQWCIHASINESATNISDVLDSGLNRELNTPATIRDPETGEFIEYDGNPSSRILNSGTYKMEGVVKRPVKHDEGLAYRIGKGKGINSIRSVFKTSHNGTRTGQENDIFSSRGIFNTTPGSKVIGEYFDFGQERRGLDKSQIKIYDDYEKTSPYVLLPSDELVFGWQCAMPFDFNRVNDRGEGPQMKMLKSTSSKITLYGSFISDHKEKHDPTNQNLTSDAVHEALQFEAPVHDRFHLEDIGYTAGSYIDDVVSGRMFRSDALAFSFGHDRVGNIGEILNRQLAGSVAEHTQGADGSCLKGVRLVDEKERFFDTVVASPSDYHIFNGNGILEWSSPLFNGGRNVKSICIGEPKPSDMKVVQAEVTNIACQDDGWYEPLPQGVIKLTFNRLWTADYLFGNNQLYYYEHTVNPDGTGDQNLLTARKHSVPWYITQTQEEKNWVLNVKDDWEEGDDVIAAGTNPGDGATHTHRWAPPTWTADGWTPVSTSVQPKIYTYQAASAGANYMFDSTKEVSEINPDDLRETYFSIYNADSDLHVIHLDWGGAPAPDINSTIITVDMSGWAERTNGWEDGDGLAADYDDAFTGAAGDDGSGGYADSIYEVRKRYADDIYAYGLTDATADVPIPTPSNSSKLSAENFAEKVAAAIDANSNFEVLQNTSGGYSFKDEQDSGGNNTYSIYIKTVSGGLTAVDASQTPISTSAQGGGIPGIHYEQPNIDSLYLYRNYYRYIATLGKPIVECSYTYSKLYLEGPLVYNSWGVVQKLDSENISFTATGATNGPGISALAKVDSASSDEYSTGYDISAIASDIGLTSTVTGVSEYIETLRPNSPNQFRHQYPVTENKNGFDRVAGYTLDGCFFQIHDGNDNAYNIWYKLDDGMSEVPPAPNQPGILITVDTITPGSPSSDVAEATSEAITSQYPESFSTSYEQGKSFFKVENVAIGETKDADSTIMGLPLTTGFYLVDDLGFEYDNESFRWAFNWGGPGFFSFSKVFTPTETYAEGRTPETEEVYWQGDPIREGNNAYHKNTNNMIDSYWLGSFPFEPRYASLFRGKFFKNDRNWLVTKWDDETGEFSETNNTTNSFFTIVVTGSNLENKIIDPTLDSETEYNVLPLLGTGETDIFSTYFFNGRGRSERKINTEFLKFYFGSGNTWQKNPELERVLLYSDGYDWPSYVPRIRGWKYGLLSALPSNTTAVYRHDSFGQFRDMLEQRSDARFYKTLTRGRFKGRSYPSAAPVRVRFVDEDGRLTIPDRTWSQNLSRFCTSSLPFFDDGIPRNREEIDPTTLNTSLGIIKD